MLELIIAGRVGKDAVSRHYNGQYVINFSVCHSVKMKDSNGKETEKVFWINCTMWRDKDTITQHIRKGDYVLVRGFPTSRAWQDANKNIHSNIELNVHNFNFVYSAKREEQPSVPSFTPAPTSNDSVADDLPF